MTGIATNVFKRLFIKKQDALGTVAAAGAAGSSQSLRRVTSTLDVNKASYQSNEVIESQQVRDMRHGVQDVGGSISGELSVGTYQKFFESVLRKVAVAGAVVNANNISAALVAPVGSHMITLSRAAGSYWADGLKIGDVVNVTGFTAAGVANNDKYAIVVSLTATVATLYFLNKSEGAVKAAGDDVVITVVGKKTWVPANGQTRDYYTIEHWFADIGQSELFSDCVVGGANVSLPPSGMATVEFPIMGLGFDTSQAQYFTNPAAPSTGRNLAAANGVLIVDGAVVGLVTGINFNINGQYAFPAGDGVVGSNERPDVLPGVLTVTGQMTVLFANETYRDKFLNEEEASIASVMTDSNVAKPGFTSFVMSRVKYSGSTKDDAANGLTLTMPFQALEQVEAGGAGQPNEATTISIQDSAFA